MKIFALLLLFVSCSTITKTDSTYNATLDGYKYPYTVEKILLKTQKQELNMAYMYVKTSKKVKKEKNVVLLHGKNFAGFYWESIAKLYLDKGYNVIIPDQLGFGKSDKPENYQYSFTGLALNTKTLLDSLNIKNVTVVGHSMGGMLATKFTKIYPNTVEKLILINPIGLEDYLRYTQAKDIDTFYAAELKKTPESIRDYQIKNYYDGKWNESYEKLIEYSIGQLSHPDYARVAWNSALLYGPIFNESIVDDFKYIDTAVVMILGTRDRTGPGKGFMKSGVTHKLGEYDKFAKSYKKILKNGKVIPIVGLGHMPQFEDFDKFKKVFVPEIL